METPLDKPAFLNVTASANGRRWVGPTAEEDRLSEAMAQQTGLAPALCRVLVRRGVDAQDAPAFLAPTLRDLLPDPRVLKTWTAQKAVLTRGQTKRIAVSLTMTWMRHLCCMLITWCGIWAASDALCAGPY
ncbi:probable single-stranded DNA-specific exonuclease [Roseobacter sp. CCS2]|nr:probable single-stranded DNA-specific exonuclease [Roseobacter sp. CCS2]